MAWRKACESHGALCVRGKHKTDSMGAVSGAARVVPRAGWRYTGEFILMRAPPGSRELVSKQFTDLFH